MLIPTKEKRQHRKAKVNYRVVRKEMIKIGQQEKVSGKAGRTQLIVINLLGKVHWENFEEESSL